MVQSGSKAISILAALFVLALPYVISGCGGSQSSTVSGSGGGSVARDHNAYKALDSHLIDHSNNVQVQSTPEAARRAMRRQPDQVIDEGGGVTAHYYNADGSSTSEKLRLRYAGGHLISKEILPPDPNFDPNNTKNSRADMPVSNAANYIDMREYNPKAARANSTDSSRFNGGNPTDNANASFNNDFNAKLNGGR